MKPFEIWNVWTTAQKFSFVLLLLAGVANARAFFLHLIDRDWRFLYLYRALTLNLLSLYAIALFFGWLGPQQYGRAVEWLFSLLFLGVLWAPLLHIGEERAIRRVAKDGLGNRFKRTSSHSRSSRSRRTSESVIEQAQR